MLQICNVYPEIEIITYYGGCRLKSIDTFLSSIELGVVRIIGTA